jgi:AcrR family transcriptional regulator
MPRLWNDTIAAHRQDVRDAILNATSELVAERGLLVVTMSEIADRAGIGRATLYKYFPDADAILLAWHEQQIDRHLSRLEQTRDSAQSARGRLEAVLEAYALMAHDSDARHDAELAALLHRDEHVALGQRRLRELVRALIADAAASGDVRADLAADELAVYCVHALGGARALPSKASVRRLVDVTLSGLRPRT